MIVQTELGYLIPSREKPIYVASEPGADARLDISARFAPHAVSIHDAREAKPAATLDVEGFALVEHETSVSDFHDAAQVRDVYGRETADLVRRSSGSSHVVVFDHTRRSDSSAIRGHRNTREPAAVIHNDYTDASARRRAHDILPAREAEARLRQRFAIINVWRSIAGPVLTTPLAVCDASSIRDSDLVASERRASDRIGELQLVTHNPEHRWYWYSAMTPSEALLIKAFDSSSDGRARRSIHTAFVNPDAPADAAPRESIETRALVFFD